MGNSEREIPFPPQHRLRLGADATPGADAEAETRGATPERTTAIGLLDVAAVCSLSGV